MTTKKAVPYIKMFSSLSGVRSKTHILNVTIFKYSLHKFRENTTRKSNKFTHDVQLLCIITLSKFTINCNYEQRQM